MGPHTPGFVADASLAEQLAEIGVILLMFGVGLQFHVEELLAVRHVAVPGAIAQSAVATALGALLARAYGWRRVTITRTPSRAFWSISTRQHPLIPRSSALLTVKPHGFVSPVTA